MKRIPTPRGMDNVGILERIHPQLGLIDSSLLVFAQRYGYPYAYAQEQNGRVVQNLFPILQHEKEQISSSSRTELEMHTETAFHSYRPDYVVLLCLRADKNAGTTYSYLPDILSELSDNDIEALSSSSYITTLDKSFISKKQPDKEIPTKILSLNPLSVVYDRQLMRADHEPYQSALARFSTAVDRVKRTVYLEEGEALVMDNQAVIHGRTAFSPRYDGTDRWIKRVMVKKPDEKNRGYTPEGVQCFLGRHMFPVVTSI